MTTNTAEFLAEQKRLTEAATPGPWATTYGAREPSRVWGADDDAHPLAVLGGYVEQSDSQADAAFIAAARTSVPRMIAALEAVMAVHRPDPMAPSWCCCEQIYPCSTVEVIEAALTGSSDE